VVADQFGTGGEQVVTGVDRWLRGDPQISEWPRRFALHRWYDPSEQSGTGVVAFGTVYPSGRTTLAWCCSDVASVTVYDSPEQVERIHGHGGYTDLVWLDPATPSKAATDQATGTAPGESVSG
jgi:hypothetical protein